MATLHEYARSMSIVRHVLEKDPAASDRVHVVTSFADADFMLRSMDVTVLTAEDGYSRDVSDPILGATLTSACSPLSRKSSGATSTQ